MQLLKQYKMLESLQEEVPNLEADSEAEDSIWSAIFWVESDLLYYTRAPGIYQKDPGVQDHFHKSVAETACHFWTVRFPLAKLSCWVDCNATNLIPSSHL